LVKAISTSCISNGITDLGSIELAIAKHAKLFDSVTADSVQKCIKGMQADQEDAGDPKEQLNDALIRLLSLEGLANAGQSDAVLKQMNEIRSEVIQLLVHDGCDFIKLNEDERMKMLLSARAEAQVMVQNFIDFLASGGKVCEVLGSSGAHRDEVSSGDQQGQEQRNVPVVVSKKNDNNHDEDKDEQNEDEQSKDQGKENGETDNQTGKSDTTTENPKATGGEKADDETEVDNSPLLSLNSIIATEAPKYEELEKKLEQLSPGEILAVKETNIVLLLVAQLEVLLNQSNPQLDRVPKLIGDFLTILSPLSTIKSICAEKATIDADNTTESLINLHGDNVTFGSIALQCEKNEEEEADVKTLPAELEEMLSKAKEAISKVSSGDKTIGDTAVKEFVKLKSGARNVMANIINLFIGIKFAGDVTIEELYSGLSKDNADPKTGKPAKSPQKKKEELLARASELAAAVNVAFDSRHVSALQYLVSVVMPAQYREDESISKLTNEVAYDLRKYMCLVGSKKRTSLRGKYKKADNMKVNGQDSEDNDDGVVYCSGNKNVHTDRRNRIITLLINFFLQVAIKKRLPDDLFQKGFVRCLLFSTPTKINLHCNFLNQTKKDTDEYFFVSTHDDDSETAKTIRENIIASYNVDAGKQNLLLEADKEGQMESLLNLLKVPVVDEVVLAADSDEDHDIDDID